MGSCSSTSSFDGIVGDEWRWDEAIALIYNDGIEHNGNECKGRNLYHDVCLSVCKKMDSTILELLLSIIFQVPKLMSKLLLSY